ncbi:MAG: DUF4270 domain-containing protein [Prevotellaceae bacterium]|jgi:hypothetical protein|nr:DUF4270 domain-containing protein [Prevotellaceae bacterium]
MKHLLRGLPVFLSFAIVSCTNDSTGLGSGIQPETDIIEYAADTFHVVSDTMLVDYIYAVPDSFLLGYFHDEKYGSTRADIFAQLKASTGFKYNTQRPNFSFDSAQIVISYYSWFGDGNSPMQINIYEMKGEPFSFSGAYPSNINPDDYADFSKPLASQVIVAKDTMRYESTAVIFKLSPEFVQRFIPDTIGNTTYASDEAFFNFFKGIYITTDFGTSTMLAIRSVGLYYYYSYDVVDSDTTYHISQVVPFPANREVRQVNRIQHPNRDVVKPETGKSYVSSPANIFTRVKIPLKRMHDRMKESVNHKEKLVVSSALLKVEVSDFDDSELTANPPKYMLLTKESTLEKNYGKDKIPASLSDTAAIYAEYKVESDTARYYSFNLSGLIATELRNAERTGQALPETLDMILMPFSSSSISSSSTAVWAKHMIPISGVTIRGGSNSESPMRIKIVYSGF